MKPGFKTTEFWVTMGIQLVGFMALMGWFTPEQSSALTTAVTQLGGIAAMLLTAFGYTKGRSEVKSYEASNPPEKKVT